ncbi:HD family phosphohydrolase [Salirhabdus sp. Marseille-P4669]|uniref:HD family phosphohydrolase n=1 Tax=Salirhabdus sp. Marseille-P4669 TaxID=2042310 RepID=UPI000C7B546A|nr:HDIG domain-containing metalloprotein [Salirhabdus sp. Marseille-P4669]
MVKKLKMPKNDLFKRKSSFWMMLISVGIIGMFFFVMGSSNVQPDTYEIEKFTEAKETIYSPITVTDQKSTDAKIQQAIQAVEEQYTVSSNITEERIEYINEIFDAATKILSDEASAKDTKSTITETERLQNYEQLLSEEIINNVSTEVLRTILNTPDNERQSAKEFLVEQVKGVLNEGVRSDNLEQKRMQLNREILYSKFTGDLQNALRGLASFAVVDNAFPDAKKTTEAQKEAANNVDPVVIKAGDILVEEGEIITSEIYDDLALAGVLKNQGSYVPLIGLLILSSILSFFMFYEWLKQNKLDRNTYITLLILSIGIISIMKVFSYFDTHEFQLYLAVPTAAGVMLIKLLINERFAIVMAVMYAIMGTILFNFEMSGFLNIEAGLYLLFSQLAGIYFLKNVKDRVEIIRVGLGIFITNIFTILIFVLLSFEQLDVTQLLKWSGLGLCSAFLSIVLTIGLLPFFEAGLNILTESKLLALANPNHPLLRKILVETPGTYHHSVMVANLSEAACEAVGANGLLARVAAYYHDIGKSVNPQYFIENQMGKKNPHDLLPPEKSAEIIINHPYDGAYLLKQEKMPKEIIDIAEQHHGTTLLKYFYFKAKEKNPDIQEAAYRYPGPKPQTKEAAIVCVCDSVEAAVRSMHQPSMEKIEETVKSIVNDKLTDGQFDESPLTFQDVHDMQTAICEMLKGIFHSRIEYPNTTNDSSNEE